MRQARALAQRRAGSVLRTCLPPCLRGPRFHILRCDFDTPWRVCVGVQPCRAMAQAGSILYDWYMRSFKLRLIGRLEASIAFHCFEASFFVLLVSGPGFMWPIGLGAGFCPFSQHANETQLDHTPDSLLYVTRQVELALLVVLTSSLVYHGADTFPCDPPTVAATLSTGMPAPLSPSGFTTPIPRYL